jgi:TolA-binding protein
MFAEAAEAEAAGKTGAAEKSYRRIVRDYPFTNAAPAAQFRLAASLEQNGKLPKAFDAYQELIETYRKTPQFAEALDRQYGIAMQSRGRWTRRI